MMATKVLIGSFFVLVFSGCENHKNEQKIGVMQDFNQPGNLLTTLNSKPQSLMWLNEPDEYTLNENGLFITVGPKTDFFHDPFTNSRMSNAPFLYKEVQGDFVATAVVKPDFTDLWNAMSLMVHVDSMNWIKFAFENSDATGKGIVSLVTKNHSDDANGPILNDAEMVWLKIARLKNCYSLHWSLDGHHFYMARLAAMPHSDTVKIGIEAQCPDGEGANHEALYFSIEPTIINDLRNINH